MKKIIYDFECKINVGSSDEKPVSQSSLKNVENPEQLVETQEALAFKQMKSPQTNFSTAEGRSAAYRPSAGIY